MLVQQRHLAAAVKKKKTKQTEEDKKVFFISAHRFHLKRDDVRFIHDHKHVEHFIL